MKKRYSSHWKSLALVTAVAMAIPAYAADQVVEVETPAPYALAPADNLTITADGSIRGIINADVLIGSSLAGVNVAGDYSGTLLNNGAIELHVTGTGDSGAAVEVYGINIDGRMNGAITNNGTIDVTASGSASSSAYAAGIYVDGGDGASLGAISNSGSINVTASAAEASLLDYYASAYGIYINGEMDGAITNSNSGTISATANAISAAYAAGIYVNGNMDGVISNSGTISATANATSYASAYGIYVGGDVNSSISNSGTIIATAESTNSDARAYGISTGNLAAEAAITNSGTITVSATGTDSVIAYGIETGSLGTDASITNSGTITVTAISTNSDATAYGIRVGELGTNASITNSGTITANATGTSSVSAYGIETGNLGAGASIANSGTITARAISTSYSANAYGISTGALGTNASISNSGTITATARVLSDGTSAATAYGIQTSNLAAGASITNSGVITVTAQNDSSSSENAKAYGIRTGNLDADASITNSDTINVSATATEAAFAYGIRTGSMAAGASVTNSDDITVTAISSEGSGAAYAYAYGIQVNGSLTGWDDDAVIENSGTIDVSATASATASGFGQAYAYGIQVTGSLTGGEGAAAAIENSGTIEVSASDTAMFAYAEAYGILVSGSVSGGAYITNSDSIDVTATATGGEGQANAYGIRAGSLAGGSSITNDGTISATANATSYLGFGQANAYGIYVDGDMAGSISNTGTIEVTVNAANGQGAGIYVGGYMTGTISNSGTITATGTDPGEAYSIVVEDGEGSVSNSGTLRGNIYLGDGIEGGGVSLTNTGLLYLPAEASGYVGGDYTQAEGGMFKIDVNGADGGQYGNLTVGGTATLEDNAKIRLNVNPVNTLADGNTLVGVIDASPSIFTLYSGPTYNVTDNSVRWQFTPELVNQDTGYESENGETASDGLNLAVSDTGMTNYQAAVQMGGLASATGLAGVLDDFYNNGAPNDDFEELLYTLGSLSTPGEVAAGVSQLQPLLSGGASLATLNALHGINRLIQSRLAASGLSYGDEAKRDSRVWLKPFGSWTSQDDRDGAIGYDADTYGLAVGADTEVTGNLRLGAAFAYSRSEVDGNSAAALQTADVDTFQVALYGSYKFDDSTELNFQGDIGKSSYEGLRTINLGPVNYNAVSDYDSMNYHVGVGLGRNLKLSDKTTFTPSLRVDYAAVDADGYTETGSGPFNLTVDGHTVDELIFAVDGKLSHAMTETTTLTGNLGLGYDAIGDQASITSSFVGGGSNFVTNGIDPSSLILRGGLGLVVSPASGIEIVTRYDVEAREDFTNQTGSIKFRMPF